MSVLEAASKALHDWEAKNPERLTEGGRFILSRAAMAHLRAENRHLLVAPFEPGPPELFGLPIEVLGHLEGVRVGFVPPPTLPASLRR